MKRFCCRLRRAAARDHWRVVQVGRPAARQPRRRLGLGPEQVMTAAHNFDLAATRAVGFRTSAFLRCHFYVYAIHMCMAGSGRPSARLAMARVWL